MLNAIKVFVVLFFIGYIIIRVSSWRNASGSRGAAVDKVAAPLSAKEQPAFDKGIEARKAAAEGEVGTELTEEETLPAPQKTSVSSEDSRAETGTGQREQFLDDEPGNTRVELDKVSDALRQADLNYSIITKEFK